MSRPIKSQVFILLEACDQIMVKIKCSVTLKHNSNYQLFDTINNMHASLDTLLKPNIVRMNRTFDWIDNSEIQI